MRYQPALVSADRAAIAISTVVRHKTEIIRKRVDPPPPTLIVTLGELVVGLRQDCLVSLSNFHLIVFNLSAAWAKMAPGSP